MCAACCTPCTERIAARRSRALYFSRSARRGRLEFHGEQLLYMPILLYLCVVFSFLRVETWKDFSVGGSPLASGDFLGRKSERELLATADIEERVWGVEMPRARDFFCL